MNEDSLEIDGVSFDPNAPVAGATVSQAGNNVTIELPSGQVAIIEDVDLSDWQIASLPGSVDGTTGDDRIDGSYVDADGDGITDQGQSILAGEGDDRIYDGAGDDTVEGGAGRDIFYAGDGADQYSGGEDRDEIYFTTSTSGLTIDTIDNTNSTGIAAGDTFDGIEYIHGSEFGDVIVSDLERIYGRGGDDVIQDGSGSQRLIGGAGSDTFRFVSGDDSEDRIEDFEVGVDLIDLSLWGVTSLSDQGFSITEAVDGQGNLQGRLEITYNGDSIRLDGLTTADITLLDESHFIFADPIAGGDVVDGTTGDDRIDSSYVDADGDGITDQGQSILAGEGDDRIYDGAGDDTVEGGAGRDIFYAGDGADQYSGGEDRDEIYFTTSTSGLTVDTIDNTNSTGIAAGDTFDGIEYIHGSEFGDVIVSDLERIYGRGGDDVIQDGSGSQRLIGGAGSDTFRFVSGDDSEDRIEDFEVGVDLIDLSLWGVTSLSEQGFSITEAVDGQGNLQGRLEITYNGDSIRLDGLTTADISLLDESHFIFG